MSEPGELAGLVAYLVRTSRLSRSEAVHLVAHGSLLTRLWREMDSNPRSPVRGLAFFGDCPVQPLSSSRNLLTTSIPNTSNWKLIFRR
jgi:hypothetical protein